MASKWIKANGTDHATYFVGTLEGCGLSYAKSLAGCVPHYAPKLASVYDFRISSGSLVYLIASRKDGERMGKREAQAVLKELRRLDKGDEK